MFYRVLPGRTGLYLTKGRFFPTLSGFKVVCIADFFTIFINLIELSRINLQFVLGCWFCCGVPSFLDHFCEDMTRFFAAGSDVCFTGPNAVTGFYR